MRSILSVLLAVITLVSTCSVRADWPTFRHDNTRSGYTSEPLGGQSIEAVWVYRSANPPQPAWPGPARWDSYANVRGLGSMRNYDPCFHVSVEGDRVFFGSSTDDSVRALEITSGKTLWTYTTDGPVRIAPTVADGLVYFSSDDGCAYCVKADNGSLVWKAERSDNDPLILNNGRAVTLSPSRSGVLIDGDIAYFAQGMLPWGDTVVSAVNRHTGKVEGEGTFQTTHFGLTMEGALLCNGTRLIAPAGRVAPEVFTKADGKYEGRLEGSGGSSVVLTPQDNILCGPGNKKGWISETSLETKKEVTVHNGPVAAVLLPEGRIMVSRTRLLAYDASGQKRVWSVPCRHHNEIIVAGDVIYTGGNDAIAAWKLSDGQKLWEQSIDGAAFGLAVTDGHLYVSTDTGAIHCFRASDTAPSALAQIENPEPATAPAKSRKEERQEDLNGLLGHWQVHRQMSAIARRRGVKEGDRRISDLTGNAHALIAGEIHVREVGGVEALEFDGETNTALISDDLSSAVLPKDAMTVETWVRVDESDSAGGIIGCLEESKQEKAGWMLGFHHQQFVFVLTAAEGSKGLTYVRGKTKIKAGHWYHVVAQYDGEVAMLTVNGEFEADSEAQNGPLTYPKQGFFEIGAIHDSDSFHPLYGMLNEVRLYDRSVSEEEIARRYAAKRDKFNVPIELAAGPYLQFMTPETAKIRWETAQPMPSCVVVREKDHVRRFENAAATTQHELIVDQLPRDRMLYYAVEKQLDGQVSQTVEFELDTHFNFSIPAVPQEALAFPADEHSEHYAAAAQHVIRSYGLPRGICLVMGNDSGRLAWEIIRQSDLRVIAVDTDADKVQTARQAYLQAGVYGTRVAVHHVDSYSKLPFVSRFANVITSEQILNDSGPAIDLAELFRVLRPQGGLVCLAQAGTVDSENVQALKTGLEDSGLSPELQADDNSVWLTARRSALAGAGEWSHLYGKADNSAFGGEELSGASTTSDMNVQWIGRPGPRAQPDRNGRKPSPLSTNGRLFVQGLHRIIAVDSFNGTILWAQEIPSLERFNMPRDCSNWCADENFVYIAAKDRCWQLDATTGDVVAMHDVAGGDREDWTWDWGFIAQTDGLLLGSSVKAGTAFVSFWGDSGAGWYDARSGPATYKVCSDSVFARNVADGSLKWNYQNGVIINPTITAADGRVYFVETRSPDVKEGQPRRVGSQELWEDQFLVALDLHSGEKLWEQPIDTADGTVAFYLATGEGHLVVNASTNKQYEVTAFSAANGEEEWSQTFDWFEKKGDHGKAIQRPAIVNGRVYVRPRVMELADGELLDLQIPKGKCGTYAATTKSLIYRTYKIAMWNSDSGSVSEWDRMRPGCWLSTIPANGMLLSPEGGGGCSCGSWMEMSVGFMPTGAGE